MSEITLDEIDRTITVLKLRVLEQAKELSSTNDLAFARELRPAHLSLIEKIYRMSRIRDGLSVNEPAGKLH